MTCLIFALSLLADMKMKVTTVQLIGVKKYRNDIE